MTPRIYVETTIPSFYHETRTEPDMVARRDWTRQWWEIACRRGDLVTSLAVIEELEDGDHPRKAECLKLIAALPVVAMEPPIAGIVATHIEQRVMPRDPTGHALHLALASFPRCHFLVTWNCAHLANANKAEHIRHVNSLLGLHVPVLTTPWSFLPRRTSSNERRRSHCADSGDAAPDIGALRTRSAGFG